MTKDSHQHHRHHKEHTVRQGRQAHGGGGRVHAEDEGLQLPRWRLGANPDGYPRIVYPKGWRFNELTPGRTALLLSGGMFLLIVACMALAKLLAG